MKHFNEVEWAQPETGQPKEKKAAKQLSEWSQGDRAVFFYQGTREYPSKYNIAGSKEKGVLRYIVTVPAIINKNGTVSSTEEIVTLRSNMALLDRVKDLKPGQLVEVECTGPKESENGYKYIGFKTVRVGDICHLFETE